MTLPEQQLQQCSGRNAMHLDPQVCLYVSRSPGMSLCIYFLNISLVIIYRERVRNMNSLSYNDNE